MSVNNVLLIGRLGKDPEGGYGGPDKDKPYARFSIATSERWRNKAGQRQEKTVWHEIRVFGQPAEWSMHNLKKGSQVCLEGSIDTEEWVDKKTAHKRRQQVVKASKVHGVGRNKEDQEDPGPADADRDISDEEQDNSF